MTEGDRDGVLAIARDVASGARRAVDVITIHLDAIESSQDTLNAFTMVDGDRAIAAAEAVDELVAAGEAVGPLAGVPIGVKDLIDHKGRPTTNGGGFEPVTATTTATCVARLEAAGAVMVGRTGLHEFAFGFSSENPWFGPVRNPWDTTLSPGGSSGGSGAAVAAGLTAGALGTDTGGSVRVPAALCGVVGLKVTHGRVPLSGVTPLAESVDTVGPIARNVGDAAAMYVAMAGDDPTDPWSRPRDVEAPGSPADLARLRVGLPRPWTDQETTDDIYRAFRAALNGLADAGAEIVDLDLPDLAFPGQLNAAMYPEVAHVHRLRWETDHDRYGPDVRQRIEEALHYDLDAYISALRWRGRMRAIALRALATVDVLMTPTVAARRKPIGTDEIDVGGGVGPYRPAFARFTAPVNHLRLPALAVPLPSDLRPPPSLQVVGPPWSEHRLLEIGLALEAAGIASTGRPPHWRP